MPEYPVWQSPDGSRYALTPTGARSLDTPANIMPRGTTQAFGARMKVMNLAANPEAARRYFETIGYETRPYGNGWNFTYRKQGSADPWQPLDPSGPDIGDLTDIISDVLIGVGSGIASGVAATSTMFSGPGAIAAGAAAGGVAAAGLESARQGLGTLGHIPNNVDVGSIVGAGAMGALAEPAVAIGGELARGVGRVAQPILRQTGLLTSELTAKFVGIRPVGKTTAGRVMMEAHAMTGGGKVPLLTSKRAGNLVHRIFRTLDSRAIPQVERANLAIADAADKGVVADLASAMKVIEDRTLKQTGTRVATKQTEARTISEIASERSVTSRTAGSAEREGSTTNLLAEDKSARPFHTVSEGTTEAGRSASQQTRTERRATTIRQTQEPTFADIPTERQREFGATFGTIADDSAALLDHIRRTTGYTGSWDATPVSVAWRMKQILQDITYGRGVTLTAKPSDIYSGMVREAAAKINGAVRAKMEQHVSGFGKTMDEAATATRTYSDWRAALRIGDKSADADRARTEFIRRIYGEGQTHYLDVLNDLDRLFSGTKRGRLVNMAQDIIRQANIGRAVGAQGLGDALPLLTATGKFRGLAAFPVAGALFSGNLPLAAIGAAAGSPRLMMRYGVTAGSRVNQAALDTAAKLSRAHLGRSSRILTEGTLTTAQVGVLRQAIASEGGGSKGVARQDQPRRRLVFGGG